MRWKGKRGLGFLESVLGVALFLERKAVYDLTHFLLKLFEYFLLIRCVWTPSIQWEGMSNNFLSMFCSFPGLILDQSLPKLSYVMNWRKHVCREGVPLSSASCPGSGSCGGNGKSFMASKACQRDRGCEGLEPAKPICC